MEKMWKRLGKLTIFNVLLLSCCFQLSECLIVPQELPSILSLVYSNIPPIKKGTDSRLGFGFRLGEHADFQILLELGPQKETRPIGDTDKDDNSFNKRQVNKMEQWKALMRQRHQEQQKLEDQTSSTERSAPTWLETWSKDIQQSTTTVNGKNTKIKSKSSSAMLAKIKTDKEQLLPTPAAVLPAQALQQLQLLYKMATTTTTTTVEPTDILEPANTTTESSSTTKPFRIGALHLGPPRGFKPLPKDTEMPSQLLTNLEPRKTKAQITAELSDVSMEEGQ